MALKHADGEGQRRVQGEDAQQPLRQDDLLRRQLLAEDGVTVAQPPADGQHQRPQHQVGGEEHAVEHGHALFVLRRLVPGVVPHVGAAQAEAKEV